MLSRGATLAMAVASGVTVANVYLNQPLLAAMARDFGVTEQAAGLVATASQVGYALGILLIVPLGDVLPVRRLVAALLAVVAVALAGAAFAPGILWLSLASLLISASTVVPQILMPVAAALAPPGQQAAALGRVQAGLASGIILSRTVSGSVGAALGWRSVYLLAAPLMLALCFVLPRLLPATERKAQLRYGALLRSLGGLFLAEPALRLSCFLGATVFGAFSAFWTTLVFFLEAPPYRMGSDGVAILSLLGVAGIIAASFASGVADRYGTRFAAAAALAAGLVAWLIVWTSGDRWWTLVIGVNLLNVASTVNQITNQSRVFALRPEARSRLNTVYMVCTFAGGAAGSSLGALAWSLAGWGGVCAFGVTLVGLASLAIARRSPTHVGAG